MATQTEVTIQLHICQNIYISLCTYVLQPGTLTANFEAAKKPVLAALKEKYGINAKESEIEVFSPTGAKSLRDICNAHVGNRVLHVNVISSVLKKEVETLQTQAPSPSLLSEVESSSSDSEDDYTLELDEAILKLQEKNKEMRENLNEMQENMNGMQENMNGMKIKLEQQIRESNNIVLLLYDQKHTTRNYRNRVKKMRKANDKILLRALANTVQGKIDNECSIKNLSEDALTLLDEILRQGNVTTHPIDQDEIRKVIKESGPKMPLLKELFEFAYNI